MLEDVVAGHNDDHARERRGDDGHDKAHLDTAERRLVGEHAGDRALADLVGAAGREIRIVLLAEVVHERPLRKIKLAHTHGAERLEREDDDHHDRRHVDDEQDVGVDMREDVRHGVRDLLLLELRLRLGNGEVMPLALIGRENGEQEDREAREDDRKQRRARLRERLVRHGRTGQTDDLGVDGVIAEQRRRAHGAQARDKRHDREREERRQKRREHDLPEHLEGLRAHVAGGLDGVVVDAADGVAQEERVVARAGERHREEHRIEAGEPVDVDVRERVLELRGDDAVAGVQEHVARDERDAGVDERRHIAETEDLCALDVKVLGQQHDGNADDVDRDDKAQRQLERVPHILGHGPGEEEADDREGIGFPGGVLDGENAGERVQARQQHKPEEEIREENAADDLQHFDRLEGLRPQCHFSASSPLGA